MHAHGAEAQVLCLHGKRQDGEIFSQRLEKLTRRLAPVADFTFVDAPFLLELDQGQTVPMREWWRGQAASDDDLGAACAAIREAHGGPFDGIIGFSQGAALGALLAATRADGPGASVPALAALKFLLVAGAFVMPGFPRALQEDLPSLHVMSVQDTCVNAAASADLARLFSASARHTHEQGHALPVRAADLDLYQAFITARTHGLAATATAEAQATAEQKEELEAIQAIFMEDVLECTLHPPSVCVAIRDVGVGTDVALRFDLPQGYPETQAPTITVLGLPKQLADTCLAAVRQEAAANGGAVMLFQLVNAARECLDSMPASERCASALAEEGQGEGQGALGEDSRIVDWLKSEADEDEVLGAERIQARIDALLYFTLLYLLCLTFALQGVGRRADRCPH